MHYHIDFAEPGTYTLSFGPSSGAKQFCFVLLDADGHVDAP